MAGMEPIPAPDADLLPVLPQEAGSTSTNPLDTQPIGHVTAPMGENPIDLTDDSTQNQDLHTDETANADEQTENNPTNKPTSENKNRLFSTPDFGIAGDIKEVNLTNLEKDYSDIMRILVKGWEDFSELRDGKLLPYQQNLLDHYKKYGDTFFQRADSWIMIHMAINEESFIRSLQLGYDVDKKYRGSIANLRKQVEPITKDQVEVIRQGILRQFGTDMAKATGAIALSPAYAVMKLVESAKTLDDIDTALKKLDGQLPDRYRPYANFLNSPTGTPDRRVANTFLFNIAAAQDNFYRAMHVMPEEIQHFNPARAFEALHRKDQLTSEIDRGISEIDTDEKEQLDDLNGEIAMISSLIDEPNRDIELININIDANNELNLIRSEVDQLNTNLYDPNRNAAIDGAEGTELGRLSSEISQVDSQLQQTEQAIGRRRADAEASQPSEEEPKKQNFLDKARRRAGEFMNRQNEEASLNALRNRRQALIREQDRVKQEAIRQRKQLEQNLKQQIDKRKQDYDKVQKDAQQKREKHQQDLQRELGRISQKIQLVQSDAESRRQFLRNLDSEKPGRGLEKITSQGRQAIASNWNNLILDLRAEMMQDPEFAKLDWTEQYLLINERAMAAFYNRELKAVLDSLPEELPSDPQAIVKDLENRNQDDTQSQKVEVEKARTEIKIHEDQIQRINARLAPGVIDREIETAQDELDTLSNQIGRWRTATGNEYQVSVENQENQRQKLGEVNKRLGQLKTELSAAEARKKAAKGNKEAEATADREIRDSTDELARLNGDKESAEAELKRLETKIDAMGAQLEKEIALKRKVERLEKEKKELPQKLKDEITAREENDKVLRGEITDVDKAKIVAQRKMLIRALPEFPNLKSKVLNEIRAGSLQVDKLAANPDHGYGDILDVMLGWRSDPEVPDLAKAKEIASGILPQDELANDLNRELQLGLTADIDLEHVFKRMKLLNVTEPSLNEVFSLVIKNIMLKAREL